MPDYRLDAQASYRFTRAACQAALLLGVAGATSACGSDQASSADESLVTVSEAITEASGTSFLESGSNASQTWDDIWAESDNRVTQSQPDTVYAIEPSITLSNYTGSSQNYAYLRFIVDNFTATPTNALIWLYIEEGEPAVAGEGLKLRVTTDAWSPNVLTYNNAPGTNDGGVGIGGVIADFTNKAIPDGANGSIAGVSGWQSINVSSIVKGNGVYSFRLAWSSSGQGTAHAITFRTRQYRVSGSPYDLNHQCGGQACIRLQVTGPRNPRSSACPAQVSAPVQFKNLPTTLNQASGLVASARNAQYYFTHNDRSNQSSPGKFFMIGPLIAGTSGTPANTYTYTLPPGFWLNNSDTEEIQVGPGPKLNTSYVYLGDIGDNNQNRDFIQIFRAEEPATGSATVSGQILKLQYPIAWYEQGQPREKLNSEAFLVDPVNGDLYIIEKPCAGKGYAGVNRLYTLPMAASYFGDGLVHELSEDNVGIDVSGFPADSYSSACSDQTAGGAGRRATGATINRTGTAVAVTFYGQTKFWWLNTRGDLYTSFGTPFTVLQYNAPSSGYECDLNATNPGGLDVDTKREAIAFTRDNPNSGVHFFTTGEATSHPIWRY